MKYIINYTDNERCASRGWYANEYFEEEFEFESDKEAFRKALEIQEQDDYDEFEEEFNDASVNELKDWVSGTDIGFGSPVVFFIKREDGEMVYDSDMRAEEWQKEDAENFEDENCEDDF